MIDHKTRPERKRRHVSDRTIRHPTQPFLGNLFTRVKERTINIDQAPAIHSLRIDRGHWRVRHHSSSHSVIARQMWAGTAAPPTGTRRRRGLANTPATHCWGGDDGDDDNGGDA